MRMLGEHYRLFVNKAGVYHQIAGEVGFQPSRQTNMRDQSAKGDLGYAVKSPGKTDVTMACNGKLQLPDADGIERIHGLAKTRTAELYQIRVDPTFAFASGTEIFQASMYASDFSAPGANDDDNATFSFNLTLAEPPTLDQLTPS